MVALALALVALAHPGAGADYQGSSLYDNVAPESQVQGSLADRYPLNRYGLDYHVTVGVQDEDIPVLPDVPSGVDLDGLPALILHALAAFIWDVTRFLLNAVIALFTFAFSLDLLAGSSSTGNQGALTPIADATRDLYDALGQEWLAAAIALVGGWAAWRALVQREYAGTFSQLALSVGMTLLAMLLITQPQWTIGGASKASNELSLAVLGALNEGDSSSAKTAASNQLFETLIYDPWVVLSFGGTEHCVDANNKPVKPKSAACRTLIDHKRKYAERWLRAGPPNSKERIAEYNAIREAKAPGGQSGYELSEADKPAVDIQQQAMGGERLGYAVLIFGGSLGAIVLLGGLSIGVILAQVLALLLFAFGPLVMLAAVIPGPGHATFRTWVERLFFAITRKVWYALILAILLAISSALLDASANLGWLMAFGLQCTFYWAVFLYRKEIYNALIRAWPGSTGAGEERRDVSGRARDVYYTGKLLAPAAQAAASTARIGLRVGGDVAAGSGRAARDGLKTAGHLVEEEASRGFTTRLTEAASLNAAALGELEHEHRRERRRLRQEEGQRSRLVMLERRGVDLSPNERQELTKLQQGRLDEKNYRQLSARVGEVEKRRAADEPPFTEEQVRAKAREIAARGEEERDGGADRDGSGRQVPSADYNQRIDWGGGGRDDELKERLDESRRVAERVHRYSTEEFNEIFPDGAEPPPTREDGRRGRFDFRRRRAKRGGPQ